MEYVLHFLGGGALGGGRRCSWIVAVCLGKEKHVLHRFFSMLILVETHKETVKNVMWKIQEKHDNALKIWYTKPKMAIFHNQLSNCFSWVWTLASYQFNAIDTFSPPPKKRRAASPEKKITHENGEQNHQTFKPFSWFWGQNLENHPPKTKGGPSTSVISGFF